MTDAHSRDYKGAGKMAINKIIAGTWKDVELLNRLNERLRSGLMTRKDFLRMAAVGAASAVASPYLINKDRSLSE